MSSVKMKILQSKSMLVGIRVSQVVFVTGWGSGTRLPAAAAGGGRERTRSREGDRAVAHRRQEI